VKQVRKAQGLTIKDCHAAIELKTRMIEANKMKRTFIIVLTILLTTSLADVSFGASIVGSKHDLSDRAWSGGKICIVCHTPHNADPAVKAPLWNHEVTTENFSIYNSTTIDATDLGQPSGISLACLSCHDGTVALDSFGGASGTEFITGDANLDIDISDDHPISFTYNNALATADGALYDPTTKASGLGGTIQEDMLFNDKLECASCHAVHDPQYSPFLRKDNNASSLCLTCHNK